MYQFLTQQVTLLQEFRSTSVTPGTGTANTNDGGGQKSDGRGMFFDALTRNNEVNCKKTT